MISICLYKCPICNAERVSLNNKVQSPCKLCGHDLKCIDEDYGRFLTGYYNTGIGINALNTSSTTAPNAFIGGRI